MKRNLFLSLSLSISLLILGCDKSESPAFPVETINAPRDFSTTDPNNDDSNQEAPPEQESAAIAQILLFNGIGTSVSDWQSLEKIIRSMGLSYRLVNSAALTSMTSTELKTFKLILIPGGNSNVINRNLSVKTRIKVRQAVRDQGVSFLGICAGAFAAVGTDAFSNTTAYYGFSIALGKFLVHWYPNGNSSLIAAVPKVTFADGTTRHLMWWDGPATPEWKGGVVARYPGGTPAISQTYTGKGFVIVSGPHPEAPASWQWDSGPDPDGADFDIAANLIRAAMNRAPLPVF